MFQHCWYAHKHMLQHLFWSPEITCEQYDLFGVNIHNEMFMSCSGRKDGGNAAQTNTLAHTTYYHFERKKPKPYATTSSGVLDSWFQHAKVPHGCRNSSCSGGIVPEMSGDSAKTAVLASFHTSNASYVWRYNCAKGKTGQNDLSQSRLYTYSKPYLCRCLTNCIGWMLFCSWAPCKSCNSQYGTSSGWPACERLQTMHFGFMGTVFFSAVGMAMRLVSVWVSYNTCRLHGVTSCYPILLAQACWNRCMSVQAPV